MKNYEAFLISLNKKDAIIYKNESLKRHCSFKIGGYAKYFLIANNQKTLQAIIQHTKHYLILGTGTNILFNDKFYDGTILKLGKAFQKIKILKSNIVKVGAGINLYSLNAFLLKNQLGGLEWSFGIPGTVGGAIINNAGAFGGEISNHVISVKILAKDGSTTWVNPEFSYRYCSLQDTGCIILETKLKLSKSTSDQISSLQNYHLKQRKKSQPYGEASAGSIFKRIIKNEEIIYPAKIIDNLGLKGAKIKDAEISTKHAGFIVNKNNASAKDVKKLIKIIKKKVKAKTGLVLKEEINIL